MTTAEQALADALKAATTSVQPAADAAAQPGEVDMNGQDERKHSRGFPKVVGQTQVTQRHVETVVGAANVQSRGT